MEEEDFEAELEREYEKGKVLHEDRETGSSLVDEKEKEKYQELKYRKKFKPIGSRSKEEEAQEGVKVKYVKGPDGKLKKKVKKKKKLAGDVQSAQFGERERQLTPFRMQEQNQLCGSREEQDPLKTSEKREQNQLPIAAEEWAQLQEKKSSKDKPTVNSSRLKTEKPRSIDDYRTPGDTNIEPIESRVDLTQTQEHVEKADESADDSDIFSDAGSDYKPSPPPDDAEDHEEHNQSERAHDYFKGVIGLNKSHLDEQRITNLRTSTMEQLNTASSKQDDEDLPPTVFSNMSDNDDGYDIEGFMGGEGQWDDDEDDISASRKPKKRRKRE
ncbi:hypothetical protein TRICI_006686 [Trichomonascus ciferrii]|uniref:Uncharacterized protein n=1 Tax=Trichomonascus ciferrii TaxID=44093 RepID=A0A642UEW6_9ASCO|nr:hypothetical protein TRICI_006686 [Trichomonascus ciferrii]